MSRTVSARIPREMHEDLRKRCNLLGESMNDFIAEAIRVCLYYDGSSFDFGLESEEIHESE